MEENRKQIIVKEILNWKESRMLPEHYCDYLLALYTEGNQQMDLVNSKKDFSKVFLILLMFLIPLSVILIYFTELSFILQMTLFVFFILLGIFALIYFSKKGISRHIPVVVTALLILLFSVEMVSDAFANTSIPLYLTVVLNCLLWILGGWKLRALYLSLSGYIGIILIGISIFI